MLKKVYLIGGARTPIGSLLGSLKDFSGVELSIHATKGAFAYTGIDPLTVDEVIMGNVISAGLGQNPARQISIATGVNPNASCTNINKVCSSGLKSVMMAAQSLALGQSNVALTGGFESMTNAPHLLKNFRQGVKFGDYKVIDSVSFDGLTDPYDKVAMGFCGEHTAREMEISREVQDEYCDMSYNRAREAAENGTFDKEIVHVPVRKGDPVRFDEEPLRYKPEKIKSLNPVFVNK